MKTIDLRKLANNFAQEKFKEERYQQRNDAKFRAVHQRCANYDEFRQIVDASHLRPLDRNETLTLERRPLAWNQPAANLTSPVSIGSHSIDSPCNVSRQPTNHTEFLQQWRRLPTEMKLDYLRRLDHLDTLFHIDIPTDLLRDLPLLYRSAEDADVIIDVLIELTKSKRFELTKNFLSNQDKCQLDLLFSRLSAFVRLRLAVLCLRLMYFER